MNFVDLRDMALVDLRPARNARLDHVTVAIKGQLGRVPARKNLRFRPGPNPAHFPSEDVEDLRNLIEPQLAKPSPNARDPIVIVEGHRRAALVRHFDVAHRPELVDGDLAARETDPL